MNAHHYGTQIIRIGISLIVAVFMTLHGRWHEIARALITPTFYFAILASFFITYLLLYLIHFFTAFLDKRYPLNSKLFARLVLQILIGIGLPAIIDFVLMFFYFKAIGRDIFTNTYLLVDFPIVVTMLLLLNGFYLWSGFKQEKHKRNQVTEPFVINHDGTRLILNPITDIIYFYKDRKLIRVYTTTGKEYCSKSKIEYVSKKYEPANFCQINPSAVVNLRMVKGYVGGSTRDTWQLLFMLEHYAIIKHVNPKLLRVTKKNFEKFKNNLEALQAED